MPSFELSSHISGEITNPSPQIGTQVLSKFAFSKQVNLLSIEHVIEHPSLLKRLPSSQLSGPIFFPSPQLEQIPIGEAELLVAESHWFLRESLEDMNRANSLGTLKYYSE